MTVIHLLSLSHQYSENKDNGSYYEHQSLTLANLLNENIWKQRGIDFSSYKTEHPYISKPVLLVKSKDPKKSLLDAAEKILEDVEELRKKSKKELK